MPTPEVVPQNTEARGENWQQLLAALEQANTEFSEFYSQLESESETLQTESTIISKLEVFNQQLQTAEEEFAAAETELDAELLELANSIVTATNTLEIVSQTFEESQGEFEDFATALTDFSTETATVSESSSALLTVITEKSGRLVEVIDMTRQGFDEINQKLADLEQQAEEYSELETHFDEFVGVLSGNHHEELVSGFDGFSDLLSAQCANDITTAANDCKTDLDEVFETFINGIDEEIDQYVIDATEKISTLIDECNTTHQTAIKEVSDEISGEPADDLMEEILETEIIITECERAVENVNSFLDEMGSPSFF